MPLRPSPRNARLGGRSLWNHYRLGGHIRDVKTGRFGGITGTAVAVGAAIALEISGPARPWTFCVRLPLAVLALSAGLMVVRRCRRRGFLRRIGPAPMATPCLVLSSTAGVTAVTVQLLTAAPALAGALAAASAGILCLTFGLCLLRLPGKPVGAVGIHPGRELPRSRLRFASYVALTAENANLSGGWRRSRVRQELASSPSTGSGRLPALCSSRRHLPSRREPRTDHEQLVSGPRTPG